MTYQPLFSRTMYCGNLQKADLQEMYDWVVEYNPDSNYPQGRVQSSYKNPPMWYEYPLIVTNSGKYVVAAVSLSEKDCDALAAYCKCRYHQYAWYNPIRFCVCRCCCGCISAGPEFAHESIVKAAVKAYNYVHEIPFSFT